MRRSMAATLFFLLAQALPLLAQPTITLRFVDFETGRPISKARVTATWWNGTIPWTGEITPAIKKVVSQVSARTGADGTIRLALPAPLPEHLEIASPFDTVDGLDTQVNISETMKSGTTVIADADNSPSSELLQRYSKQAPGEVLIFTRKLTARDRYP